MRLRQKQKPTLKTSTSIYLRYAAIGMATAVVIFIVVFIYNSFVNVDATRAEGDFGGGVKGPGYALTFDGVDDYVALDDSFEKAGQFAQITIEAWVNTTAKGGNNVNDEGAIIDFDGNEYFSLYIDKKKGRVSFRTTDESETVNDLEAKDKVNDGEWHHIAAVYDGKDKVIYIDGKESASVKNAHSGQNLGTGKSRFGFIGEGSKADSYNGSRKSYYFEGSLDDVRLWHIARSLSEIRSTLTEKLSGNETGLLYYFNFDEGVDGITSDKTRGVTGTLSADLSAGWMASGVYMGDQSSYAYDADEYTYSIPGKGAVTVTITDGKPQGIHIYYVGAAPNDITLPDGIESLEGYYWGVYVMGNTKYTLTYDYSDYEGAIDTAVLVLAERPNSGAKWAHGNPQKGSKKLVIPNQTGTEYILGSGEETVMPIELLSFEAVVEGSDVIIDWTTTSELNNDFFTIERSRDGKEYQIVGTVDGAGNSDESLSYSFTDRNPMAGKSYYRLKQTDFDGKFEYFAPALVSYTTTTTEELMLSVYPNPSFNQTITVTVEGMASGQDARVVMMDLQGNAVFRQDIQDEGMGAVAVRIDPSNMSAGNYLVMVSTPENKYTKQVILRK
ncbi:hypothetical protein C900_00032 [Fulvivirga imtechensis AK7]|uniref:Laminin G domain-containing protein n=1 Tax=Fulvivirga imtechensis AK7 TaxID=1237149 RepID=L8K0E3_9BACT|nr:LamG-like jellyroll fold domain-containing protein [Fulvivirga imtechensis]ELR73868.1 hypothetical protein C900_00032 [Fulvivirga imtechensis AK7]